MFQNIPASQNKKLEQRIETLTNFLKTPIPREKPPCSSAWKFFLILMIIGVLWGCIASVIIISLMTPDITVEIIVPMVLIIPSLVMLIISYIKVETFNTILKTGNVYSAEITRIPRLIFVRVNNEYYKKVTLKFNYAGNMLTKKVYISVPSLTLIQNDNLSTIDIIYSERCPTKALCVLDTLLRVKPPKK